MSLTPQEKQQLKARFFGQHIGCRVKCFDTVETEGVNVGVHKMLSGAYLCTIQYNAKLIIDELLYHCKLILRPLSSITDAEAIECAALAIDDEIDRGKMDVQRFYPFDDALKTVIRVNYNDENCAVHFARINYEYILDLQGENNVYNFPFERVLDYLRSKSFCLPFMGLDPVAEGWAILEEK